jgi:hypothetical protein
MLWRKLAARFVRNSARIHLYTFSWNEERMLPFFFRHYDPFVGRYVFYDDGSSDATLEMLKAHPRVEIREFERTTPGSFVASAQSLQNTMWKESRGDCHWVIVTAVDEHLHHAEITAYLAAAKKKGITAIPALGYDMATRDFPAPDVHLASTLMVGVPNPKMSKLSLFDPNAISETNFAPGRHRASLVGDVRYPEHDELLNLHFKYLGWDYFHTRSLFLASGLGPVDRTNRWGNQYDLSEDQMRARMQAVENAAFDVMAAGRDHHSVHTGERWWRLPVGGGPVGTKQPSPSRAA